MPKRPTTVMVRKNALKAKRRAHSPLPEGADPINDTPEKLETGREVVTAKLADGSEPEYTVSPFRAMLADRGKTIRVGDHVPSAKSRQGVMYGAGLGLSQTEIARIMGISLDTLRSHYEEELQSARSVMMSDIQTNLYNIARDPKHKNSVQAGMFLLSKLGGDVYREKKSVELSGPDGQPLQIDQQTRTIDPTLLNPEQRDALRDILNSAMRLAQQPGPAQIEGEYRQVEDSSERSD